MKKIGHDLEAKGLIERCGTRDEEEMKLYEAFVKAAFELEAQGLIKRVGMRGSEILWDLTEAGRNADLSQPARKRRRISPSKSR